MPADPPAPSGRPKRPRAWALYWCESEEHTEDCFVTAKDARTAARFFENTEGFGDGETWAERIVPVPCSLEVGVGYATEDVIIACGGVVVALPPPDPRVAALHEWNGFEPRAYRVGERTFVYGDIAATVLAEQDASATH